MNVNAEDTMSKPASVYDHITAQFNEKGMRLETSDGGYILLDDNGVTIGGGGTLTGPGDCTVEIPPLATAPDTTPAPPLPGTVDAALEDLNAAYDAILASIPQAQDTITTLAAVDPVLARLARDFFNRFLKLTGSSERVRLPNEPERTTSRERTVTRTYDRYTKAKRAEAAAKRQADDLQACLEYAVATTEPEDAYDLSNEERKTQREIDTLCRFIDAQRDIEARAAVRAETAQRVLVEMGELVE